MKTTVRIASIIFGALFSFGAAGGILDFIPKDNVVVYNQSQKQAVWVTVYDFYKLSQLSSGCVMPREGRLFPGPQNTGQYNQAFNVRAEVMEVDDCKGKVVCDTTAQVAAMASFYDVKTEAGGKCFVALGDPNYTAYREPSKYQPPPICVASPGLPNGSYLGTCRGCGVRNDGLGAECKDMAGQFRTYRTLNAVSTCQSGTVRNDGSILRCDRMNLPPGGTYRTSCQNLDTYKDPASLTLSGECKNRDGKFVYSFLPDTGTCRADTIRNQNGSLLCIRASWPANTPWGSYLETCNQVLMEDIRLGAKCLTNSQVYIFSILPKWAACKPGSIRNDDGRLVCDYAS